MSTCEGYLNTTWGEGRERPTERQPSHHSAIDGNHRAGHIVAEVTREKLDHFGAILHGPKTPQSDQLGSVSIALVATPHV
jgi:hypothetical protein